MSSIVSDTGELSGEHKCDHGRNFKFPLEWDAGVSPEPCEEQAVVEVTGPTGRIGGIRLCKAHAERYAKVMEGDG